MLDDTRNQLQTSKNQHLRQIEMMESEELVAQKKVRSEMIQMEDVLAQIRKEYEMLRIEFEQNMAANEQTAPINREMRHLITSLQNHNGQLKGEVNRYKRKYKDATTENAKLRKDVEDLMAKSGQSVKPSAESSSSEDQCTEGASHESKPLINPPTAGSSDESPESSRNIKDEPLNVTLNKSKCI